MMNTIHQLNKLGQQGWELVAVTYNDAYLKREKA